jgi:hypothetical protein
VYSQVIENTLHVRAGAPFTLEDIQALRDIVNTWDNSYWKTYRCQNVLLNRIRIKALDAKDSPMEDYALPIARPGAYLQNALPLNVTFAIKLGSTQAGRSQRGRIFIPGVALNFISGQVMGTSLADAFVTELNALKSAISAHSTSWQLGVVSYRADKAWRTEGQFTPVSTIVYTDLNLDSQRRRLTGRGRT